MRYIQRKHRLIKAQNILKDSAGKIEIPLVRPFKSEAEVQALLWNKLISLGLNTRLEVNVNSGTAIFDLVVYSHLKPIIVEVKTRKKKLVKFRGVSEQMNKYLLFDSQALLYCCGEEEIDDTIQEIRYILGIDK